MNNLPERAYVSASRGAAMIGVDRKTFARMASEGRFAVQSLPGMLPRYCRADIEAFIVAHTEPPRALAVAR